jgi:hypothetical protein
LAGQLRVRDDMIVATIRHIDDTHALVAEYCWRAMMAHDSLDGELAIEYFQTLSESDCDEDRLPATTYG